MSEFVTVAKVGDIPEGEGAAYPVGEKVVAVFNDAGEYYAINDMCPHMGASLADGQLENSIVACPWHGWRFCVHDGTWCDNRRISTDTFELRIAGEEIQIRVPETADEKGNSEIGSQNDTEESWDRGA